ncbi:hypothetical protein PF005_g31687 [Phytophthora fragariae]|uniref:Uncharacterized protein n=1 Tax=Phytophthora fragariae TaxID=53985 RepID=A0A6A3D9J2_9STRA|nr:hypothetical protein PF009_g32026 [Phytophthora fragariae]KAE9057655.1 hypothetical protein PF007_g31570 [Phytophthora fragariae]KAE9067969.1 hypothetical protein PF006_g29888 [Phytophthora fragariae]KAE9149963.1 hypothetical protein PF004_g32906 [Phytophthora fragariae]KAE9160335.1 hypothetical protein PF005_g31687 [Phytophthora fragariae]
MNGGRNTSILSAKTMSARSCACALLCGTFRMKLASACSVACSTVLQELSQTTPPF